MYSAQDHRLIQSERRLRMQEDGYFLSNASQNLILLFCKYLSWFVFIQRVKCSWGMRINRNKLQYNLWRFFTLKVNKCWNRNLEKLKSLCPLRESKPDWGRLWVIRPVLSMWLNKKPLEVPSIPVSSATLRLLKEISSSPSDYVFNL